MSKTFPQLAAERRSLKQQKSLHDEASKKLGEEIDEIDQQIQAYFQEQGVTQMADEHETIFINEMIVPHVTDWNKFSRYIMEHDALHLLQRRPAVTAYRESLQAMEEIDGVEPVTIYRVNARKKT